MSQPLHPKQPNATIASKQFLTSASDQPNNHLLSQSKAESLNESRAHSTTAYFDITNKHSVKPLIYTIFNVIGFVCNFNYSVENALITMMMITFLTPNIVDSLIWIIPNLVSIFVRPYLIRYVHKTHRAHRIRNEAFLVSVLLVLVAVGSLLIGQSGLMNQSKKGFHALRILVCSIGWTLTGMSLELVQYFTDKLKKSFQNQCYIQNLSNSTKQGQTTESGQQFGIINFEEEQQKQNLTNNFKFLGSILGYLVVLALFTFPFKSIKKTPSFFTQSSLVYNVNAFLTLFGAVTFYALIAYSGLPKPDPQLKPKPVSFRLSYSLNYYLPGFSQLKSISLRGLAFLAIHFMMIFVMDVMFIYTTMWTAGSVETADMKTPEANFYGITRGVFYLIVFTLLYFGKFLDFIQTNKHITWAALLSISCALFLVCFFFLKTTFFLPLIATLALWNKTYENHVEPFLEQIQPQIKVCKQVIVRIQKVAVLNVLPFISMILLGRDDIQDCMVWCAFLLLSIGILLMMFLKDSTKAQTAKDQSQEKTKNQ